MSHHTRARRRCCGKSGSARSSGKGGKGAAVGVGAAVEGGGGLPAPCIPDFESPMGSGHSDLQTPRHSVAVVGLFSPACVLIASFCSHSPEQPGGRVRTGQQTRHVSPGLSPASLTSLMSSCSHPTQLKALLPLLQGGQAGRTGLWDWSLVCCNREQSPGFAVGLCRTPRSFSGMSPLHKQAPTGLVCPAGLP